MPEFDEPIDDYVSFFKDEHERNVNDYFESLLKTSGVDEQQNIELNSQLRELNENVDSSTSSRGHWKFGRVAAIVAAVGLVAAAIALQGFYFLCILPAAGLVFLLIKKINPAISSLNEKVDSLTHDRDAKSNETWAQIAPLNDLYTWDMATKLFMKTFPFIDFDLYISTDRLADLQNNYELSPTFNDGRSMFISQSGAFKGNPFVIARYKQHWIGSKSYVGTLVIHWTETVRDAQGNWVNVQRTQTLSASVVKPFPEYHVGTTIIYGHETAPDLRFSRTPSNLSGLSDGLLNNWKKDHAVKKVEKQARKAVKSGDSGLTVMSNKEFEALFNAIDRDNEVEFRLLFTPLAQQEMVKLLNDKNAGFGDDFAFSKSGMVNFVAPNHLSEISFDCDPARFKSQEIAKAREFFNKYQNDFFRSVYFGFAPLWTIPIYREKRSIPLHDEESLESSFWEHEAIANLMGQQHFKHPASVTENILKTSAHSSGPTKQVTVTAHGYEGIPRVDIIPVLGGDGRMHPVPVPWTEYIAVSQDSTMLVGSISSRAHDDDSADDKLKSGWESELQKRGISAENTFVRGAIAAALLR
jgi:hypothetical protein